jgi:hypothetical protein
MNDPKHWFGASVQLWIWKLGEGKWQREDWGIFYVELNKRYPFFGAKPIALEKRFGMTPPILYKAVSTLLFRNIKLRPLF